MKKFKVNIIETFNIETIVEANNINEAWDKVEQDYNDGNITHDLANDFVDYNIQAGEVGL